MQKGAWRKKKERKKEKVVRKVCATTTSAHLFAFAWGDGKLAT